MANCCYEASLNYESSLFDHLFVSLLCCHLIRSLKHGLGKVNRGDVHKHVIITIVIFIFTERRHCTKTKQGGK